ncbi:MAG: sulfonate transport system substrate-binding protein [Trebonia sp.]|jgi:sulfonate transport system substrate-binding protein|nr:aliphatic sulfonates family transporter, periplasmic ligand-binding protein [Actinomycetes bacterium]MDX6422026.1 sulfonate transport system substrate-binding protein [Trebonia sp.]
MKLRRKLMAIPVLALTGLAAAACSSSGSSSSSSDPAASSTPASAVASASASSSVSLSSVTLNIGDQKGTGAEAVLQAAGLLNTLPFKVTWDDFTSGPPMLEAAASGSIDIGGVGDAPPVFAASGGEGIVVVGARTVPSGDQDAVVVPKGSSITSIQQLKGKKIAYGTGSSGNYQLLTVLNKAGLTSKDVDLVNLQPAEALAAFTSGSVDAWDIWPPYVQQVVAQDGAKVLAEGSQYGSPYSFEVASKSAVANPAKAAAIQVYLTTLDKAYVWAEKNPTAWGTAWAAAAGLPASITDAAAKVDYTVPVPITGAVTASLQGLVTQFYKAGQIPKDVNMSSYVTTQFNSSVGGS